MNRILPRRRLSPMNVAAEPGTEPTLRKPWRRTWGDGYADSAAPAPQGPPVDQLIAWAKLRRRGGG